MVNFDPSIGHEYQKVRPALIVQDNTYIIFGSSLLTVIPISSQIAKQSELDLLILPDTSNRLLKTSVLKVKQISSFDQRRFIKYIGFLQKEILQQVDQRLQQFLFGKIYTMVSPEPVAAKESGETHQVQLQQHQNIANRDESRSEH